MAYTEIKVINNNKYFYRVRSIREEKKFRKDRIYLGKDLSKEELSLKEREADKKLNIAKKSKIFYRIVNKIVKILKKNKIKKAGLFGSYATGKERKNSDIDILIDFNGSLLYLVRIEREIEESLGKKVDLLTYNGISPLLKKRILEEEVKII